ncbi:MAG: APC family permease [Chloroflexota bacterium]|nr:APC family permease [Chloroflexota bacterium]
MPDPDPLPTPLSPTDPDGNAGSLPTAATVDAPPAVRVRTVRAPRKSGPRMQPDLVGKQEMRGKHIGDRYVRVCRMQSADFALTAPGHLVATEESLAARGPVGRVFGRAKRVLIGAPISTAAAGHERLTKVKALAVLSSDALSSVAYASEEILRVLLIAGVAALSLSLPIGAAIVVLLVIVGISYRQTIKAYPNGGGAYIVAKDNLGDRPALIAGGALLIDYILTVAVSIAAAVAAIVSALPQLHDVRITLGIALVLLVTVLNLRGVRESGTIFAIPTYLFIAGMFVMLTIGLARNAAAGFPVTEPSLEVAGPTGALGIFLILRAFSSGCTALTGVEAISDGVPAFKKPEWKNARTTLTVMIAILAVTFSGITFLAHQFGAIPMNAHDPNYETVVSQIARTVFWGESPAYYYIQFATTAILVLAANTAYSDFPRLAYFLARDRYMPRQFTFRGDRLAYTTGILVLGVLSAIVLALFRAETENLIPLYAVGVFTSFTLSQAGMVRRWLRLKGPGWQSGFAINLTGAILTGVVALIIGVTKFLSGAWIVVVLIPLLMLGMRAIYNHYTRSSGELAVQTPLDPAEIKHTVVVPISTVNRVARQTLAYARSISDNVTAVYITDDETEIEQMRVDWQALGTDIPLVIIESPYRSLVGPLLSYVDEIDRQQPNDTLTVVLPEFVARHWWEQLLHNQTALRIKAALLFRPGTVVTSVPYHLERHGTARASEAPPPKLVDR